MGGHYKDLGGLASPTSKVESTSPSGEIQLRCSELHAQLDWSKYEGMAGSTIAPKVLLASPAVLLSRFQRGPFLRHHLGYILLVAFS